MSDSETIRQALDYYERWTEDAPELRVLCDAARAHADWLDALFKDTEDQGTTDE